MLRYRCPQCGAFSVRGEECPGCGAGRREGAEKKPEQALIRESTIFYCDACQVPVWDSVCPRCGGEARAVTSDLRPVFPEERLLMEILLGKPLAYLNSSVWFGGGRYLIDGAPVTVRSWKSADAGAVREELERYREQNTPEADFLTPWVEANRERYQYITAEATQAIREAAKGYSIGQMFVSFSGGKDSTVTSDLVMRAMGTPSVIHLYGDTTLEFPETEEYAASFRRRHPKTPFMTAKNEDKDFFSMCEVVGPPSRVMRWCCTVFKTGAITRRIEGIFPGERKILSFQGIRRSESTTRAGYSRMSENSKISKQVSFSPIIDWLDFDVWLYLLTREREEHSGVSFNEAYRKGYTRVGCWCCPNNSEWSTFLTKVHHPEQYERWRRQLIAFARKVGKPDPEVYVDEGGWKARQGGNGLEISRRMVMEYTPCVTRENTLNFSLARPVEPALYELFRPFGEPDFEMGNPRLGEVYILDRDRMPILRLQGRTGKTELKVSVLRMPFAGCRNLYEAEQKIRCQLAKYQICLGCSACVSVCTHDAIRQDAITISPDGSDYRISDRKCVRCGACVTHFDGGCYMRDVIRIKTGGQDS